MYKQRGLWSESPESRIGVRRIGAVVTAHTRDDHHHSSLQQPSSGATEGHLNVGGVMRHAASGVRAPTTVPELVRMSAVAALVYEPGGAW